MMIWSEAPHVMNRAFMRSLLVEESFAYGFTIAFWGSGLLLINEYGLLHTTGLLEYAIGAITGFGVLAIATFGGAVDTIEVQDPPSYFVLAGIHYLSGLIPIIAIHLLLSGPLGKETTLFLAGMAVDVLYNVVCRARRSTIRTRLDHRTPLRTLEIPVKSSTVNRSRVIQ